jgi:murein L,D-transpeptidase YafK
LNGVLALAAAMAASADAPRARVVAGAILRDGETARAIQATATTRLPKGAGLDLVVTKSRYRLDVRRGARLLKVFPVAFGRDPVGPKTRAGDGRTPEGRYTLVPHHASPGFGRCFYVGYPNQDDARRAREEGRIGRAVAGRIASALGRRERPPSDTPLGGLILLHGTKQRSLPALTAINWTDGCIAMENADVDELLAAFAPTDRPVLTIDP